MQELRFAIRRIASGPGRTLASVATLGCSIAAAAATWTLLSATLVHPLSIDRPDRWFVLNTGSGTAEGRHEFVYPFLSLIHESGMFEAVVATWTPTESLEVGWHGTRRRAAVAFATHDFLQQLGVQMWLGRGFGPHEDRRGAEGVAILAHRHWRRAFNADPAVIGQTITIGTTPVTIVGVADKGFRGLELASAPDLYLPLHTIGDVAATSTNYFADPAHTNAPTAGVRILGRLRDGQRPQEVAAQLAALSRSSRSRQHELLGLTGVEVAALGQPARLELGRFAGVLAVTVALLVLIGCATIGLLLVVRTEARRSELATCVALGATAARLVKGVTYEAAVLSALGAVGSVPIAAWLLAGLRGYHLPGDIDIDFLELGIDTRALLSCLSVGGMAFLLITSMTGAYVFTAGITPETTQMNAVRIARGRTRSVLAAGQVAVAVVLLVGATLFGRSLQAGLALNPPVLTEAVVRSEITLGSQVYSPTRAAAFFDALRTRLSTMPSVQAVSFAVDYGGMGPLGKLSVDGQPHGFPSIVRFTAVDSDYFDTLGLRVTPGRDFSHLDMADAPYVALVSESLARLLGGGGSPVGRRITVPFRPKGTPEKILSVIGVVPDVIADVRVLQPLVVYLPATQWETSTSRSVTIRAATDVDAVRRDVLGAIREIDSSVVLRPWRTLREDIEQQMAPQRLGTVVLGALGIIALLLTIVGTYVLADSMARLRMREMGIRGALGATRQQLVFLIFRQTATYVGVGVCVGLVAAALGASTIRSLLFRVQPLDPATVISVVAVITAVTLGVAIPPAIRASQVDLGQLLRHN